MMPLTNSGSGAVRSVTMMMKGLYTIRLGLSGVLLLALLRTSVAFAQPAIANDFCQSPPENKPEQSLYELSSSSQFDAINKRGYLRVLLAREQHGCSISHIEKQLLDQFAANQQLELHWVYVDYEWNLLSSLLADEGDIIIGQHKQFSTGMDQQLAFSYTWANASHRYRACRQVFLPV